MSAPDANGWMPIETAPRDGTPIIAIGFNHGSGPDRHYAAVRWSQTWLGWFDDSDDDAPYSFLTHWQHLPKPPVQVMNAMFLTILTLTPVSAAILYVRALARAVDWDGEDCP